MCAPRKQESPADVGEWKIFVGGKRWLSPVIKQSASRWPSDLDVPPLVRILNFCSQNASRTQKAPAELFYPCKFCRFCKVYTPIRIEGLAVLIVFTAAVYLFFWSLPQILLVYFNDWLLKDRAFVFLFVISCLLCALLYGQTCWG